MIRARRDPSPVPALLAVAALAWLGPLPAMAAEGEPVLLALVLDSSGSLNADALARRQFFAEQVTAGLPPGSEVAVFAFDDQPRLVLPRSADRQAVADAAGALGTAGRFTALNDALFDAAHYLGEQHNGRSAILLVTDGLDENSALTLEDGVGETRELGIPVFTIGIGRVQSRVLRRIAKLTGGEYFEAQSDGGTIASRIGEITPVPSRSVAPPTARQPVAAAPAAPPPAASTAAAPTRGGRGLLLPFALGLVALAGAVGIWLWMRRAAPGGGHPGYEAEDVSQATLVTRADSLGEHGNTMVLTLKPLLHVIRGPDKGRLFEVSLDSAISIGRAEGNDVALSDVAVSTEHCRIRPVSSERRSGQGGTFEVIDLKSTNGTWVNERRIARHVLAAGDVVKVGESQLQLRMDHMRGE